MKNNERNDGGNRMIEKLSKKEQGAKELQKEDLRFNQTRSKSFREVENKEPQRNEGVQRSTYVLRLLAASFFHLTVITFLLFYFFFFVYLVSFIFSGNDMQMRDNILDFTPLITATLPFVLLAAALITFNFRLAGLINKIKDSMTTNGGA